MSTINETDFNNSDTIELSLIALKDIDHDIKQLKQFKRHLLQCIISMSMGLQDKTSLNHNKSINDLYYEIKLLIISADKVIAESGQKITNHMSSSFTLSIISDLDTRDYILSLNKFHKAIEESKIIVLDIHQDHSPKSISTMGLLNAGIIHEYCLALENLSNAFYHCVSRYTNYYTNVITSKF